MRLASASVVLTSSVVVVIVVVGASAIVVVVVVGHCTWQTSKSAHTESHSWCNMIMRAARRRAMHSQQQHSWGGE